LVLCVDEKSQVQALERTQPLLPMGFGHVEGLTHAINGMARPRCSLLKQCRTFAYLDRRPAEKAPGSRIAAGAGVEEHYGERSASPRETLSFRLARLRAQQSGSPVVGRFRFDCGELLAGIGTVEA
jgi:hypothetical protein